MTAQQCPCDPLATLLDADNSDIEGTREAALSSGTSQGQGTILSSQTHHPNSDSLELSDTIAACSPGVALNNSGIASLFAHYIDALAPWYDLNESSQVFRTAVPLHALDCPVLFKTLIAFAATHKHKTTGQWEHVAASFHAACVSKLLQSIEHVEPGMQGDYLAATCLLRSYEILNGNQIRLPCPGNAD